MRRENAQGIQIGNRRDGHALNVAGTLVNIWLMTIIPGVISGMIGMVYAKKKLLKNI